MKTTRIVEIGFLHALVAVTYVSLVASLLATFDGPGASDTPATFFITGFLLLFSASIAVMASLVFVRPILWYFNGKKTDAVLLLAVTLGFLAASAFGIILVSLSGLGV